LPCPEPMMLSLIAARKAMRDRPQGWALPDPGA
jgi:hypothetical protein